MELKDLIGLHQLDAVDLSNELVAAWGGGFEDCQVIRFRLDGKCYVATEDPADGYRSSLADIVVDPSAEMKNVFPPLAVMARHRTEGYLGYVDNVLELIDVVTGRIVLEVGTESVDAYYPVFVASFHPEAMAHNCTGGD